MKERKERKKEKERKDKRKERRKYYTVIVTFGSVFLLLIINMFIEVIVHSWTILRVKVLFVITPRKYVQGKLEYHLIKNASITLCVIPTTTSYLHVLFSVLSGSLLLSPVTT